MHVVFGTYSEKSSPEMTEKSESAEHELAKQARKELIEAVRAWVMSRANKTLDSNEIVLRDRFIVYDKLKRITGRYKLP